MTTFDRRSRALDWARETFGSIALDSEERAMRFVEEALELGHALGLSHVTTQAIIKRVYARPSGDVLKEMGQAQLTLDLLSKAINVNADDEADKEFFRIQKIPKEVWQERHAAKVRLGIAFLSHDNSGAS